MKHLLVSAVIFFACQPAEAAQVTQWRGDVELKKNGEAAWTMLTGKGPFALAAGDDLRTARASTAEILMDDGTKVKLAPVSAFKMSVEDGESVSLGLYFGRVRSWVKKFSKKFEVRTPSAVCAVRGTDFMVEADAEGGTRTEVYEGSVLVGDDKGNTGLVREGEVAEIPMGGTFTAPKANPNEPNNMDATLGDARLQARKEIYGELSKEDVIARAQEELQSAEFQNRKVAIDAFGNRVRMEEYTIRPMDNQFKYVVLNTRENRFDFGKILFTFNAPLPADLSLATAGMISTPGSVAPQWQLTAMNGVMSNTQDKVTEDATGGSMVYNNGVNNGQSADPAYQLIFSNYSFYAAGPAQANDNGGLGKWIWTRTGYNVATADAATESYLGGSGVVSLASGDVYHSVKKNTFNEGTWLQAEDFVLFDDGKILAPGDFGSGLGGGETLDSITDKLNFERVYTSSLFGGRSIDVMFSAKLLKDVGLFRF